MALTKEEDDVVVINDEDMARRRVEIGFGLLGRLLLKKSFNSKAFRYMITFLWDVAASVEISEIE